MQALSAKIRDVPVRKSLASLTFHFLDRRRQTNAKRQQQRRQQQQNKP